MADRGQALRIGPRGNQQIYAYGAWRTAYVGDCWQCGKPFWYAKTASEKGRFCGKDCVGKYNSKRLRKTRVWKRCVICLREYSVGASHVNRRSTCGEKRCQLARMRQIAEVKNQTRRGRYWVKQDQP